MRTGPLGVVTIALMLAAASCNTLRDEQEEVRLNTFKYNSKRFYGTGQFQRAEDACRKGLLIEPEDLSLNQVLGFALLRQGSSRKLLESEKVFELCIDIEDDFDYRSRLGLGEVRLQLAILWRNELASVKANEKLTVEERKEKTAAIQESIDDYYAASEEILQEVLQSPRGKDEVDAHSTLARLYSLEGRYEEAAEVLRSMIATLSKSIRVRSEQMSISTLPADRREQYQEMLTRLQDQETEALRLLSTVASKISRWEEVVSAYARLESQSTMDPADYFNRARAYEALHSREAAIQDYDTFVIQAAGRGAAFSDAVADAMSRSSRLKEGGAFLDKPQEPEVP